MAALRDTLDSLIAPTVEGLGYEYVGTEYLSQGRYTTLRIYVDKAEGVDVEICAEISRQVGALLDVEDVLSGAYTLEVSSPGIERLLFTPEQCTRFIGQTIQVRLRSMQDGRRKLTGELLAVEGDELTLDVESTQWVVPFNNVERAQLKVDIQF